MKKEYAAPEAQVMRFVFPEGIAADGEYDVNVPSHDIFPGSTLSGE